jgi:hypothetical protein
VKTAGSLSALRSGCRCRGRRSRRGSATLDLGGNLRFGAGKPGVELSRRSGTLGFRHRRDQGFDRLDQLLLLSGAAAEDLGGRMGNELHALKLSTLVPE